MKYQNLKFASITSLVLLFCSSAHADWQYTRWGSRVDEVLSSAGQVVTKTTAQEQKDRAYPFGEPLAKTTYSAQGVEFPVDFLFSSNGLSGVVLHMNDGETAANIGGALAAQYGATETAEKSFDKATQCWTDYRVWRDAKAGNLVSFRSWSCTTPGVHSYTVIYRPIPGASSSGL
jgi:hypothetical protein